MAEGLCGGTIVLADARTGRVIRRVDVGAHAGPVAYSRDGSLLAVVATDRVLLLDPATGRIREVGPSAVVPGPIAFSPRADVLAIPTLTGGLGLWDVANGHIQTLIPSSAHRSPIAGLAFSPDGRRLALALVPGSQRPGQPGILLLDTRTGRVIASSTIAADGVSFSADGSRLAVAATTTNASPNGTVDVLDPYSLALRHVNLATLPDVAASAVAFSPDGSAIAYGGFDGTAGLISPQTGQSTVRYLGQTAQVTQIAFAPDRRLVATASLDGTLRVWRATGTELASHDVHGAIADVQPDGRGFVALLTPRGRSDVVAQRWPNLLSAVAAAPLVLSPTSAVDAEFISDDGRLAGLIPTLPQRRAPIRVWSVPDRRVTATIPPVVAPFGGEPVFSPNGSMIAMNRFAGPRPSAHGPHMPTPSLVIVDVPSGRGRVLAGTTCDLTAGAASRSAQRGS